MHDAVVNRDVGTNPCCRGVRSFSVHLCTQFCGYVTCSLHLSKSRLYAGYGLYVAVVFVKCDHSGLFVMISSDSAFASLGYKICFVGLMYLVIIYKSGLSWCWTADRQKPQCNLQKGLLESPLAQALCPALIKSCPLCSEPTDQVLPSCPFWSEPKLDSLPAGFGPQAPVPFKYGAPTMPV